MSKRLFSLVMAAGLAFSGAAFAEGSGVPDGPGPNLLLDIAGGTTGQIVIDLLPDVAPKHTDQIVAIAESGAYDNVVFHRVIDGFMAQTGDVRFGKVGGDNSMAGMGSSDRPDLPAEFSKRKFVRGMVGMARGSNPNSANSQFFIMLADAPHLDGEYTIIGHVVSGMDVVDAIKKGDPAANGLVANPDYIAKATIE
ncbi:peptidylprolyl isomerase [Phaeovulum sp.]|uniref:peptidylprolyl isomerase n=1 Tax=Phaeovulum sp. TaxID=2934796 RepID=UPI0039E4B882